MVANTPYVNIVLFKEILEIYMRGVLPSWSLRSSCSGSEIFVLEKRGLERRYLFGHLDVT
jgi:hypothetical protein